MNASNTTNVQATRKTRSSDTVDLDIHPSEFYTALLQAQGIPEQSFSVVARADKWGIHCEPVSQSSWDMQMRGLASTHRAKNLRSTYSSVAMLKAPEEGDLKRTDVKGNTSLTPWGKFTNYGKLTRSEAHATAVVCLMLDDVGTKSCPREELPLEPSWLIETSPGNFQAGYLFTEALLPDRFDEFKAFMKKLAANRFTDPGAVDVVRVIRVPCSPHLKVDGKVFYAKVTEWESQRRYAFNDIVAAFAPHLPIESGTTTAPGKPLGEPGKDWEKDKKPLQSALDTVPADTIMPGGADYALWLKFGAAIHHASNGSQEGLDMWDGWSATDGGRYEMGVCEEKWHTFDANREGGVGIGTIFMHADNAGWVRPVLDLSPMVRMFAQKNEVDGTPPSQDDEQALKVPDPRHLVTDQANAARLERYTQGSLLVAADKWYRWQGTHWAEDTAGAFADACLLSRIIHAEETEFKKRAKAASTEEEVKALEGIAKALAKWGKQSEMKNRLDAAMGILKNLLATDTAKLDTALHLFNVANGTVNLRTGELQPHCKGDYITRLIPIDYHPGAAAPVFKETLLGIYARKVPVVQFIQRWFGYCCTAETREQCFAVHWGDGANGKSTLLELMESVMNEYATTAAPHLLIHTRHNGHPTEIADLFGRRMVTAHESGESGYLSEDFVKQATGSDRLKGRFMRKDFFRFIPTHKLQLVTNYKPGISGTDWGIWRRVMLIPYTVKFGAQEEIDKHVASELKDKHLDIKLIKEKEGVLAWLVAGAMDWYQQGLNPPDEVVAAKLAYRLEEDRVLQFVQDCCIVGKDESQRLNTPTTKRYANYIMEEDMGLFTTYRSWCKDCGYASMGSKKFQDAFSSKIPVGKWGRNNNNVATFFGARLRENNEH